MNIKKDKYTVAALVARFQVHELTEAHKELIQTVIDEHPRVLIFLGLSPVKGSITNPLEFQTRRQMVFEAFPADKYPNVNVEYLKDIPSDEQWSEVLDDRISAHLGPNDSAVLYGGRDSFLPHYKGKFPTRELTSQRYVSGTEIRRRIAEAPQSSSSFRAGAIWSAFQRFPTAYSAVDVAVVNTREATVLLARKPNETLYRFVGGFTDPRKDNSFEDAARRELDEETGLASSALHYLGSFKVDDWRYRNEADKIFTHLYLTYVQSGIAKANDDIAEVAWLKLNNIIESDIVPEHRPLFKKLMDTLLNEKPHSGYFTKKQIENKFKGIEMTEENLNENE